jgi:ABC-type glycerol-3-phosphate transport system permease component
MPQVQMDTINKYARRLVLYILLSFFTIICLFPLIWNISNSFKPKAHINRIPIMILPQVITLDNYHLLFERMRGAGDFLFYYRNTIVIAGSTVVLTCLISALAGYAFSRLSFPARNILFSALLSTMFIPGIVNLPPLYAIMDRLKALDTLWGLIILYVSNNKILGMFIMRGVFSDIPRELEDAARIDGCSPWDIFWRIMLPLGKAGLTTVAIFAFLGAWNEFMQAYVFTHSPRAMTLSVGILILRGEFGYEPNLLAPASMLSFLPSLLVFIFLQRYFYSGLTAGAIKF